MGREGKKQITLIVPGNRLPRCLDPTKAYLALNLRLHKTLQILTQPCRCEGRDKRTVGASLGLLFAVLVIASPGLASTAYGSYINIIPTSAHSQWFDHGALRISWP